MHEFSVRNRFVFAEIPTHKEIDDMIEILNMMYTTHTEDERMYQAERN